MFWPYRLMIKLRHAFPSILEPVLRVGKTSSSGQPNKAPLNWFMNMLGSEDRRVLSDPHIFSVLRSGIM